MKNILIRRPIERELKGRPRVDVHTIQAQTMDEAIAFFNGPLGRSQRSLARTAHSAHLLHSAPLCYARLLHSRARSLTSLTCGRVADLVYVFTLKTRSTEANAFSSSIEIHPQKMDEEETNFDSNNDKFFLF